MADGLTWESADRYLDRAASTQEQIDASNEYDSNPANWAYRVSVADEIVQTAIESTSRSLNGKTAIKMIQELEDNKFDFDSVFEADDYLYFYRESLTEERSQAEVDGLVELIGLEGSMKILDLACGFGRHANRLAALGHEVTGIDLFSEFLDIAHAEAEEKNLVVSYLQGDMRELNYQSEFDRILLLFTAFGYFDDETNLLVLKNIHRALKQGGLFVFDLPNRDTFLKHMQPCITTEIGEDLMLDRISFNPLVGRSNNRRVVILNGVRKEKPYSLRLYNANEIAELLIAADFKNLRFYGTWNGEPVVIDSRKLIIVAEK